MLGFYESEFIAQLTSLLHSVVEQVSTAIPSVNLLPVVGIFQNNIYTVDGCMAAMCLMSPVTQAKLGLEGNSQ